MRVAATLGVEFASYTYDPGGKALNIKGYTYDTNGCAGFSKILQLHSISARMATRPRWIPRKKPR